MQRHGNNGNVTPHAACASCKHQRKKCGEDCVLHPYFPAEKSQEFQAVHKVFGVSNVMKLVKSVDVEHRQKLADSLIWEAVCRVKDPVLGPFGEFTKISDELKLYKSQLPSQNLVTLPPSNQNLITGTNQHHHHSLLLPPPTPPQHGVIYKSPVAWNGGSKGIVGGVGVGGGGGLGYHHDNVIVDPNYIYAGYNNYSNGTNNNNVQRLAKIKRQEKENSVISSQQSTQQQHSVNSAFNQPQYYISGQYGAMNGKKMDNALWENGA